MAVAHDAVSESHTGTAGVASVASFNWDHAGGASARSALVFTHAVGANPVTGVTYGGVAMTAIPYTAYDSDTEPGFVQAWFLDNCGGGTKNIVVSRTNNAVVTYAVCVTQTVGTDKAAEVYLAGVKTRAAAGAEQTAASASGTGISSGWSSMALDDGTPGTTSTRYMAVYSGAASVSTAGSATTSLSTTGAIDYGNYVFAVYLQTTPSQGVATLNITTAISDDLAVIGLAIREKTLISGSSVAAWKFSEAATGAEEMTGASAATWKASTAATGLSVFLPTIVGTAQYGSGASWGTSHVIPLPSGYQAGDLLIVSAANNANSGGTMTPPSGWTTLQTQGSPYFESRLWWKRADGTEGSSITITTIAMYCAGMSVALRNASDPESNVLRNSSILQYSDLTPSWGSQGYAFIGMGFNVPNSGVETTAYVDGNQPWGTFWGSPWAYGIRGVFHGLTKMASSNTGASVAGGTSARSIGYHIAAKYQLAIAGTSASTFKFSETATGKQTISGTSAASFKFSHAATGTYTASATGTAASSFKFSHAATGAETISGTSAATFKYTVATTGNEKMSGTSAATFKFSDSATGNETMAGTSAATWKFSDTARGWTAKGYAAVILADNPVGYWRLGEANGTTAVDEMGNGNGTYVNSPTLGVAGGLSDDSNTAVTFGAA